MASPSSINNEPLRVAIVGGGIVGVVAALGLWKRGIAVKLYEREKQFGELGASLGITHAAANALKLVAPEAFEAASAVIAPPPASVMFDIRDGYNQPSHGHFTLPWDGISGGVHRAQFHKSLCSYLPPDIAVFDKKLEEIEEPKDNTKPLRLKFSDGTEVTADLVVGADGIGSRVRRHLVGKDHPAARARYAHRYVFRAVIPMEAAIKAVGKEKAGRNGIWIGRDSQAVTSVIGGGTLLGVNPMVKDPEDWPSEHHLTMPASKEEVRQKMANWGPDLLALIDAMSPKVDKWGLFDLAENPVPYMARGRIAIIGDAAHASTPHLGSGAAFGIEDALVLSELLSAPQITKAVAEGSPAAANRSSKEKRAHALEQALKAFNDVRLPQCQWLVNASREIGLTLEMRNPKTGDNMAKIKPHFINHVVKAWYHDPEKIVQEALQVLDGKLLLA